jgi:fibro-slime domain-containing protein
MKAHNEPAVKADIINNRSVTMKASPRRTAMGCLILASILATGLFNQSAQAQDQNLWVKVIYYDYDIVDAPRNPNFQYSANVVQAGMIKQDLSPDRKPLLNANLLFNDRIEEWFRPSGATKDDRTAKFIKDANGNYTWTHLKLRDPADSTKGGWVDSNYTAQNDMRNIIFYDSLEFKPDAVPGFYYYQNDEFFPLDNRGYGNQPTGYTHNFGFTMEIHREFEYTQNGQLFSFIGDDDMWVFINGKLVLDLGGIHTYAPGNFDLDALAATLNLVKGQSYPIDIFYAERNVAQSHIRITTNIINPKPNELRVSPDDTTMTAGDTIRIRGRIRDQRNRVMINLLDSINWRIIPPARTADQIVDKQKIVVAGDSSSLIKFTATQAFDTVRVEASLVDPSNSAKVLKDTAKVYIKAAPAAQVSIERESNTAMTEIQLHTLFAKTTKYTGLTLITMDQSQTKRYAYALTRDRFGNFVDLARSAQWSDVPDDTIFSVAPTAGALFEGYLQRISSGESNLRASQLPLTPDTVKVNIYKGVVIDLRLITQKGDTITAIFMNTDQELPIKVIGIWSDKPGVWVDITGAWSLPPDTLRSANPLPTGTAGNWTYSPINPGSGTLTVTSGSAKVSVPVLITPAPPSRMELEIRTPAAERVAGKPITVQVRIYNTDGLVPGAWSDTNNFNDKLPNKVDSIPYVVVNGKRTNLGTKIVETFNNGIDSVQVVLFYAPYNWADSLHQIYANLKSTTILYAETEKFRLLPSTIWTLQLESQNGVALPDAYTLYADPTKGPDNLLMIAMGYDKFRNKMGPQSSKWSKDGTLHDIGTLVAQQIYYNTENVKFNEVGFIRAKAVSDTAIGDQIAIFIVGPDAVISNAITRDYNGNGYLDAIEVHFDKAVALPVEFIPGNNITISYKSFETGIEPVPFTIRSISPTAGSTDSVFILYLNELYLMDDPISQKNKDLPETDWTPTISINNIPGTQNIIKVTTDGAGPVIWRVYLYPAAYGDHTNDKVTFKFSEEISDQAGQSPLSLTAVKPAEIFKVWTYDANSKSYVLVNNILKGIDEFTWASKDSVEFKMKNYNSTNELIITGNNYFSIDSAAASPIKDVSASNYPNANNHQVRVIVRGGMGGLVIGPNPTAPIMEHSEDVLTHRDPVQVLNWAKTAGAAMTVPIVLSELYRDSSCSYKVKAALAIYDEIGNLVYSRMNKNIITPELCVGWIPGETKQLALYWNGITDPPRSVRASPGIYRVVLFLSSTLDGDRKYIGNLGIGR